MLTELKGKLRNQAEKSDLERTGAGTAFGPQADGFYHLDE